MAFSTSNKIGVNFSDVFTPPTAADGLLTHPIASPPFAPGDQVLDNAGSRWIYVVAGADLAANTAVLIDPNTFTATAGAGDYKTFVAMTTGQYGWVFANDLAP